MVNERDIKKSVTYTTLKKFNYVYAVILIIPIAMLFTITGSDTPTLIVIPIIFFTFLGGLMINRAMEMKTMLKLTKTFEECVGRIVSVSYGYSRGYTKVVIAFKDFMNEDHRLTSHNLFMIHELAKYMEKDLIIYYSKEYPKVVIGSIMKDETQEEDSNGMNL
ncbi:MAG TPA: hypothetical protein PLJ98_08935 [Acholeplasmataceae bacterium]|nr:hypothetical protein [Acholeplasmataceae bacterium]